MILRWEALPGGRRGEFVDVTGLGRYVVRPEAMRSKIWRAYLNNKRTTYSSGNPADVKKAVARAVSQHGLALVKPTKDGLKRQEPSYEKPWRWEEGPHGLQVRSATGKAIAFIYHGDKGNGKKIAEAVCSLKVSLS